MALKIYICVIGGSNIIYKIIVKPFQLSINNLAIYKDRYHIGYTAGDLITGFIGLGYEGISSFLHHKRQKALHKAVHAIDNKVDLQ